MAKSSKAKVSCHKTLQAFKASEPPKVIEFMGKTFTIAVTKDLHNQKQEPCWGLFDADNRTIYLDSACPDWREILYHELMHACFSLTAVNQFLSEELEESLVRILQEHAYPLLKASLSQT